MQGRRSDIRHEPLRDGATLRPVASRLLNIGAAQDVPFLSLSLFRIFLWGAITIFTLSMLFGPMLGIGLMKRLDRASLMTEHE